MGSPSRTKLSTEEKALAINLDAPPYGTLAEIGSGQEVANWFFRVGAASGSIAKTMSAYDMTISDTIYGPARQYVSREPIGIVLSRSLLEELFDEQWYDGLDGGLLESLGRLLKNELRLNVYPEIDRLSGELLSVGETAIAPHLRKLFEHLLDDQFIIPLVSCDSPGPRFSGPDIRAMIECGHY